MFKHRKFWRKAEAIWPERYQEFTTVTEAKNAMGFTKDNPAFRFDLCSKVEWSLHDKIYLSYTVHFDTDELQKQFLDQRAFARAGLRFARFPISCAWKVARKVRHGCAR